MRRSALRAWTIFCVLLVAGLFALNLALGQEIRLVSDLILPPLLAGLFTTWRRTAIVSVLALIAAVGSTAIHASTTNLDSIIRIGVVVLAAVLAVQTAVMRERDLRTRRRLNLINASRAELEAASGLESCLTSFQRASTYEFAQWCFLDLRLADDQATQLCESMDPDEAAADEIVPRQRFGSVATSYAARAASDGPMLIENPDRRLVDALFEKLPDALLDGMFVMIVPIVAQGFTATYFLICPDPHPRWDDAERSQVESLARTAVLAAQSNRLIDQLSYSQQELRESRDQIAAIVNGVADGIAVQNKAGEMVYVNDAAARLMGFETAKQLIGQHFTAVPSQLKLRDETGAAFDAERLPSRRVLAGEPSAEQVLRYEPHDGAAEIWASLRATALHDDDGNPTMAITVIEDITWSKRRETSYRFLAEVGLAMNRTLDVEVSLDAITKAAVPALADWCTVELLENDGVLHTAAQSHEFEKTPDGDQNGESMSPEQVAGAPQVVRTGVPEVYNDINRDDFLKLIHHQLPIERAVELVEQTEDRESGANSILIVPIAAHGKPFGAITFVQLRKGANFNEYDVEIKLELGRRAGNALDNAMLHTERTAMLRSLQSSLIPEVLPKFAGVDLAAVFRPAERSEQVGGDFYDVFELADGSLAAIVGDVCGKGTEAAALTGLARHTIRAAAMTDNSPVEILKTLNRALLEQVGDGRFCTVAFARLSANGTTGRTLDVVAAGHPLPLLMGSGAPRAIGKSGTLLGVVEDPELPVQSHELAHGESVVLYTDGLSGGQTTDDTKNAIELADGLHPTSSQELVDALNDLAQSEQSEPNRDDVAIVAVTLSD